MLWALGLLLSCSNRQTWLDRYAQSHQSLSLSSRVPQVYRISLQCNLLASTLHFSQFGLDAVYYFLCWIGCRRVQIDRHHSQLWTWYEFWYLLTYVNWHIIRYKHKFCVIKFVPSFSKFSKLSYKLYDTLSIGGAFDSHDAIEAHFLDCTYKGHVDLVLMQLNVAFITYWWPTIKMVFSCVKAEPVKVD